MDAIHALAALLPDLDLPTYTPTEPGTSDGIGSRPTWFGRPDCDDTDPGADGAGNVRPVLTDDGPGQPRPQRPSATRRPLE